MVGRLNRVILGRWFLSTGSRRHSIARYISSSTLQPGLIWWACMVYSPSTGCGRLIVDNENEHIFPSEPIRFFVSNNGRNDVGSVVQFLDWAYRTPPLTHRTYIRARQAVYSRRTFSRAYPYGIDDVPRLSTTQAGWSLFVVR